MHLQTRIDWFRLAALLGLLVAFALRLFRLGAESLWYDETVSALLASKPVSELIAHTAGDIHPPGYYLLLHGWRLLAQPSLAHGLEFLLAFPSLWFGMVGVVLLFAVGRKLFGAEVGLLALGLAAVHPFQILYSQEVRMYTLAAACGLLCLWALLCALDGKRPLLWLAVYVASATVGVYSLYYFVFLWIALNGVALWTPWRKRVGATDKSGTATTLWLVAQGLVLLLWLPWLPIFWRQITEPPVPPWRTPWPSGAAFAQSLAEGFAALWVGQTVPAETAWFWFVATCLLVVATLLAGQRVTPAERAGSEPQNASRPVRPAGLPVVLLYVFAPFLLLVVLSLAVTPLYHVRYLFPFAGPFLLWIAVAIAGLRRWGAWPAAAALVLYMGVAGWSLSQFWFDPRHRADDHRGAVAYLADQWRPGDAILVNAGWVYPALEVYWPVEQVGPFSSLPPPLAASTRLTDLGEEIPAQAPEPVRTGSVDGPSSLGWGNPHSDFFAISAAETSYALTQLAGQSDRIWHYRLYDTVSDPTSLIRTWLETNTQLLADQPISGRDFLRLQLYQTAHTDEPGNATTGPTFGDAVQLTQTHFEPEATAGRHFYVQLSWWALPALGTRTSDLALSLRLYDPDGALVAQADSGPLPPTSTWERGASYRTPLSLPIPVATQPLTATLALVVYDQNSGEPLETTTAAGPAQMLTLGEVWVNRADEPPLLTRQLTRFDYRFDYIDLVSVRPASMMASPGATAGIDLVWRPRPNGYSDTYLARLTLRDSEGNALDSWEAPLGGWNYPSGVWPAGFAVLDQRQLAVPSTIVAGHYDLTLQVLRASDRQVIAARRGWFHPGSEESKLVTVTILSRLKAHVFLTVG
jgi:uncharacterized membrane protein